MLKFWTVLSTLLHEILEKNMAFHNLEKARYSFTSTATRYNKNKKMSSFKSNENIHKNEDGSYCVVSANKTSSVTL